MNASFPRVLALLRAERRISQKKAAADLGISQALLSHYEKGIRELPLSYAIILAQHYNVSIDYIVELTDDKSPK